MLNNSIYRELVSIVEKENVLQNEPMSNHTSFKIGGEADFFVIADNIEQIKKIVFFSNTNKIPLFILGNGTNILVKDNGVRGIVLKINLKKFEIEVKDNDYINVTVGAGEKIMLIARKLQQNSVAGFEFASGIPGTIGGAIKMNAGAYGKEFKDIVISTTYMDCNGMIKTINNIEHNFKYRNSFFSNKKVIILETVLRIKKRKF